MERPCVTVTRQIEIQPAKSRLRTAWDSACWPDDLDCAAGRAMCAWSRSGAMGAPTSGCPHRGSGGDGPSGRLPAPTCRL